MVKPGEGLLRHAGRLARELQQEREARARELSEIRCFIGSDKLCRDEGLRALQERIDALEQQLAEGLERERHAREGDVHELHDLLKNEIIAREGLSSTMHEVLMSNLAASCTDERGVTFRDVSPLREERKETEDRGARAVEDSQTGPAEGGAIGVLPELQDVDEGVHFGGVAFADPEVTRSALEQQMADMQAHMGRLEEIPLEHQQEDVHDLRRLLDCERFARVEQIRSVEESLTKELEGSIATALEVLPQERVASSSSKASESEGDEKRPEQTQRRGTSRSSRAFLGSKPQVEYMRRAQELASGNQRKQRGSTVEELSAERS